MLDPEHKITQTNDLTQIAYRGIRRLMFHNEIVPGQKIAYRDLAKRLGMSLTPVSNALKYLEFQGLVRKELNRGYYIEPVKLKEIEEIYDFREMIEASLLSSTIKGLDKHGEERLRRALEASINTNNESFMSERISKDVDFHITLASLSNNQTQKRTLRHLFDLLYLKCNGNMLFSHYMSPDAFSMHISSTKSCHQEIFDSVMERNLKNAKRKMIQHVRTVKKDVLLGLKRMLEDKNRNSF